MQNVWSEFGRNEPSSVPVAKELDGRSNDANQSRHDVSGTKKKMAPIADFVAYGFVCKVAGLCHAMASCILRVNVNTVWVQELVAECGPQLWNLTLGSIVGSVCCG